MCEGLIKTIWIQCVYAYGISTPLVWNFRLNDHLVRYLYGFVWVFKKNFKGLVWRILPKKLRMGLGWRCFDPLKREISTFSWLRPCNNLVRVSYGFVRPFSKFLRRRLVSKINFPIYGVVSVAPQGEISTGTCQNRFYFRIAMQSKLCTGINPTGCYLTINITT